jgi:hypothetical protein
MPKPSIFIQGNKSSEKLLNNVYYYFFNTEKSEVNNVPFGFFINLLSYMTPLGPKYSIPEFPLDKDSDSFGTTCNQACSGCCVGFPKIKNSNDAISSLKVSQNYTAILWEHKEYGGMCEIFNNNVADLNSYDMGKCFNWFGLGSSDCTSSLKVFQKK